MEERREETKEEEAIREIDKLDQEIKTRKEKKVWERKLDEIKREEGQTRTTMRKTEMERSTAKNQERTLKTFLCRKNAPFGSNAPI